MSNDCSDSLMAAICDAQNKPVEKPSTCTNCQKLEYQIALKSGGNNILTPLEIPDFAELSSGSTKNKETIDFLVKNNGLGDADTLTIEVLDGARLIYSDTSVTPPPKGKNTDWQWDGYDSSGILDTRVLKSKNLKICLTAMKGSEQQIWELKLRNKAKEVGWVDVKIDRNAKTAEITMRRSFSDGGINGKVSAGNSIAPLSYQQLLALAKTGIEKYWTRNGSRFGGADVINTTKGSFMATLKADINIKPMARSFDLVENFDVAYGRSTSIIGFAVVYHNAVFWEPVKTHKKYSPNQADESFKLTAAHEFGHLILNSYANDGSTFPEHSSTHKSTSTYLQKRFKTGFQIPRNGEIDIMHYYSDDDDPSYLNNGWPEYFDRSIASESDLKGLFWLSRVLFK